MDATHAVMSVTTRPYTAVLQAQSPVPLSQQRLLRAKFLGYIALHTLLVGCIAALLEPNPGIFKCVGLTNLCISSFSVANLVFDWLIIPDSLLFTEGAVALGLFYASIDVKSHSYSMLLNTGFMLVCVLFMIPISCITWLQLGDGSKHKLIPGDYYKQLLGAVPAAAIAYVITLVISVALYQYAGRDLFTTQGFYVSAGVQLVGSLTFGVFAHRCYGGLTRGEFHQSKILYLTTSWALTIAAYSELYGPPGAHPR